MSANVCPEETPPQTTKTGILYNDNIRSQRVESARILAA